jgi:hypothetical protein
MDDQRHTAAMSDADVDRELAQALAVDPSPEFVARVRMRIASDPAPRSAFGTWLTAAVAGTAVVIVATVLLTRSGLVEPPVATTTLVARTIGNVVSIPNVEPAFEKQYGESAFRRTSGPAKAGRPIRSTTGPANRVRQGLGGQEAGLPVPTAIRDPQSAFPRPLLDPRETAALRSLFARVRANAVDLSPLFGPGASAPMDLPVADLVIAPITIEPLAPPAGAQGPISREPASAGQGERP